MSNSPNLEKETVKSAVAGGVTNPADKARMHGALGKLLIRQKRWAHAAGELNQAVTLEPKNPAWLLARSEALEKLGHMNQALLDAADAVILDSKNPEASNRLGILLVGVRKFDQAALCFAEALNLKPNDLNYSQHLARTLELLEAYDAADEIYQSMIAQDPMRELTYHETAQMHENRGDLAKALAIYDQAIDNNCRSSEIFRRSGIIAHKMGDKDMARARFMAGLALKPNDPVLLHFVSLSETYTPKSLPDAFIAERNNQLAANYETEMIGNNYRIPGLLRQAVMKIRPRIDPSRPNPQKLSSVLDLGCGTGMIGIMLSDVAVLLKGVDLSVQMLRSAQLKGVYTEFDVIAADKALTEETRHYELITAAGLMAYIGDVAEFAKKLLGRLQPGGVVIFDFEAVSDTTTYRLTEEGLFIHNADYVKQSLEKTGFEIAAFDAEVLWRQNGREHKGYLVTATKPLA